MSTDRDTKHLGHANRTVAALSMALASGTALGDVEIDLSDPAQCRFGPYTLVERIGGGGMGVVYRAHQESLERDVAIKLLNVNLGDDGEALARFRFEAKSAAALNHPNIVQVLEIGQEQGIAFIAMQLVRGETLADRIDKQRLDPKKAVELMLRLCEAVGYAHKLQLLHLDLKPANVLIDERGEPLVADFGLARRMNTQGQVQAQEVSGTPAYMAPEQMLIKEYRLSAATDIYALGAILYEMLCGVSPHGRGAPADVMQRALAGQIPRPRSLNTSVPKDLEAICLKSLSLRATDRYANVEALADDLRRFDNYLPVSVRPLNRFRRLGRWIKREPQLAGAVGAAVLALLIGIVATTIQWQSAKKAQSDAQFLQVATLYPSAGDAAIKNILHRVVGRLDVEHRQKLVSKLSSSHEPRDWLLASLVGFTLPLPPSSGIDHLYSQVGYEQLKRAISAMPNDPLVMKVAIEYCFRPGGDCPMQDAPLQLSRIEPNNAFAWLEQMEFEDNDPWRNWDFSELNPSIRPTVRSLIRRAAHATYFDDGYRQILQAKSVALGVPYVGVPGVFAYGRGGPQLETAGGRNPNLSSGWQVDNWVWFVPGGTRSVLKKACYPDRTPFHDADIKTDCVRIARILVESHDHEYANRAGWDLLINLGPGTVLEQEANDRYRQYLWMGQQDVESRDTDPIRSGALYFSDLAKFGELEAQSRQLDRFGLPRNPPASWQPDHPISFYSH